jgi:hypothetical protein
MIKYCVYPGSIRNREGQLQTFTYLELIALYGVNPSECINRASITQHMEWQFIMLKPRVDEQYPNMPEIVDLGDEIKWGPDFDGSKKYTIETNPDELYAEQNSEEQP